MVGLMIVLKKAFDGICHKTLLKKYICCFKAILLIEAMQSVQYRKFRSETYKITHDNDNDNGSDNEIASLYLDTS